MNNSGFNNQTEMLAAQFRPLIDAKCVNKYPRKNRFNWLLAVLTVTAILMVGALWMN